MKITKSFAAIALVTFISGCTVVQTRTTAFYTPEFKTSGKIVVLAADNELNNSLEFSHYKRKFEEKLTENGYQIVQSFSEADYIALVAYGIDDGKTSIVSTPIFGQTGGGTTYSSGVVYGSGGSSSYSSSSYTMPTYGMIGSSAGSAITFTRAIALDVIDAKSTKNNIQKVYEARAKSIGSCSVIAGVFDEILEAMFKEFPGESGKTKMVEISSKGQC
ncbi:DUF4136 domain-containing protein [uncultured Nitrosomonas sp.]|uniref:DUF4136 domain-containing protein n=1 Tax=uncultured Nitrosomonas sp. TaxID=156424 RepID=UPI00262EF2DC|nr:DUF4136 domain-containing protein [uncultured Nitrosomonas sp.]